MNRQVRQISRLTPLQRDTAIVVPMSTIKGGKAEMTDVVGTLGIAIKVERTSDALPVFDTSLRFLVTDAGKFTVTNVDTGYVTAEQDATSADVVLTEFSGLKITVVSGLNSAVANDICDVNILGDSTYIVPGTILGRIKDANSDYFGRWEPVGSDIAKYDVFRVCGGTIDTNKANHIPAVSNTMNMDDKYTVDVYVFGQVIESVCRDINLTDEIKAKMQGIVWE